MKFLNYILLISILSCSAGISFAQKTGSSNLSRHSLDEKFCKSSFQTVFIGKENQEENVKKYLLSEIQNLKAKDISLQLQNTIESKAGIHFTYEQFFKEAKIFRAQVKVNLDKKGNIKSVFDNSVEIPANTVIAEVSEENFINIKIDADSSRKELVYFPDEKNLIPAIRFEAVKGDEYFEVLFNSGGKIIYQRDLNLYYHPKKNGEMPKVLQDSITTNTVFLPDPLTTAGVTYGAPYVDDNDNDVAELNAQRASVTITATYDTSAALFRLQSPYIIIDEHSSPVVQPVTSATPVFSFTRSQSGFEDINAFYHISTFHSYIQSLGFNNLVNYPIHVDTHALNGQDNSNFSAFPAPPHLNFGEGGVDDAEDADVITHEYGHAVSDAAAPNTNVGSERTALDEALGDYFASSYSRSINPFKWENVFSWDGHNEYWDGRFTVSNAHYPDGLQNDLYLDAPIWSSTMMEIWGDIGRENSDALQIEALYSYASGMKMSDAAMLVIQADSMLNNGAFYSPVCSRMYNRGLISFCQVGIEEKNRPAHSVRFLNTENFASGNGDVVLLFEKNTDSQIQLFDATGKSILKKELSNTKEFSLSGKNLAKGIYLLNVTTVDFTENFKLVKW